MKMENNLPVKWNDEEKYYDFLKRKDFYISLVIIAKSNDRFKRIIKPTKITHINKVEYLITDKNKRIKYDPRIFHYNTYEECAN